jgi:DNA-binding HxlR family transcriptional regulator
MVKKRVEAKTTTRPAVAKVVHDIIRCKWTLEVLAQIRAGVNRPGQLVRTTRGLTAKVLNERLRRLVRNGVLEKVSYPEKPPRVEYFLTPFGRRLNVVLDAIDAVEQELGRR